MIFPMVYRFPFYPTYILMKTKVLIKYIITCNLTTVYKNIHTIVINYILFITTYIIFSDSIYKFFITERRVTSPILLNSLWISKLQFISIYCCMRFYFYVPSKTPRPAQLCRDVISYKYHKHSLFHVSKALLLLDDFQNI